MKQFTPPRWIGTTSSRRLGCRSTCIRMDKASRTMSIHASHCEQVNIKTEDATFQLKNLMSRGGVVTVNGSFITEAHLVARVGGAKRKMAKASFWVSG